jgi:hypothetical protein
MFRMEIKDLKNMRVGNLNVFKENLPKTWRVTSTNPLTVETEVRGYIFEVRVAKGKIERINCNREPVEEVKKEVLNDITNAVIESRTHFLKKMLNQKK